MTPQRLFARLLAQATAERVRHDEFSPFKKSEFDSAAQRTAVDHLLELRRNEESRTAIDWLIRHVAEHMAFRIAVLVDEDYPPCEARSPHDVVLSMGVSHPDNLHNEDLVHEIYLEELDRAFGDE